MWLHFLRRVADISQGLQTSESHVSGRETIRDNSEGENLSPLGEARFDQG